MNKFRCLEDYYSRRTGVPELSREGLLERAKKGDRNAFDRLRLGLEAPVRRFLYRLVGPIPTGEDIIQDAFVATYKSLKRIEGPDLLLAFLFRVIRNLCYDELKRQGRFHIVSWDQEIVNPSAPLHILKDPRPPPDEIAHWRLLYAEVQKAMERLPELQRQTLILYCEEDFSYVQIAAAMETDIGTVKSRIHYARKNITKNLTPEVREALDLEKKTGRDNVR